MNLSNSSTLEIYRIEQRLMISIIEQIYAVCCTHMLAEERRKRENSETSKVHMQNHFLGEGNQEIQHNMGKHGHLLCLTHISRIK